MGQVETKSGVKCPSCPETFDSELGVKVHHKREHGESIAGETVECEWCGESFKLVPSKAKRSDNLFCSHECYGKHISEHRSGQSNPLWDRLKRTCHNCGNGVWVKKSKIDRTPNQYCSWECYNEYRHANRVPGTVAQTIKENLGSDSWSTIARNYKDGKEMVCRMCGSQTEDKVYDVHHIVPVVSGGVNSPELFIILCRPCHITAENYIKNKINTTILDLVTDN